MTETPALAVVKLSESFASLWQDLAQELGVQSLIIDTAELESHRQDVIAVLVSAGGEESRGLDTLLSVSGTTASPVYLIGANTSHRFGVEAVRRGAADYFALPDDVDLLRRTLASKVETDKERRSGPHPKPDDTFAAIIGESDALKATLEKARRVILHRDVTVLIGGETGTGKELLARAIHDGGPRSDGPFVAVNCAAIPANLLESELFGHVKGAFTDARTSKPGLFEEANGGTLLLDEIGHLPLELQGKLLRALDERSIRRVGSTESRTVDVRILAATHVDLEQAVARGEFRQDLFYRLNVVSLELPPLRERGRDVELLARVLAASLAERYGMPVPRLSPELLVKLRTHSWPGNVRELRHAIERSLLLSKAGTLDPAELVKED
ncbi:MAG: sigma-54-dependent Fis family transcriptional regulator, partial [Gemmatimonadota bacterium]